MRLRGNGVIDTNVPQAFHGTGFATKVPLMIAFLRLIGMVLIVELIFLCAAFDLYPQFASGRA
ncbi:hypothetical protein [Paracoccus sp. (in: a-proteobacteria)]|uniref:hypothetical protein n=1 Tax=Paracoccus sp. TaxID=267 RepID=UPI002AFEF983|nr:hypothetical protein [Paracoccus sp. (in: a-proteobacteria)]